MKWCFKITLSKRERNYVVEMVKILEKNDPKDNLGEKKITLSEEQQYDLNYRLKKKFIQLHDDYWLLVKFFKQFDSKFELRKTKRTENVLNIAKSQIMSQEIFHSSKCEFCLRTNEDHIQIREHNFCEDCFNEITQGK